MVLSVKLPLLNKHTSGYILNFVVMHCYFALTIIQIMIARLTGTNLAHILNVELVIWGELW